MARHRTQTVVIGALGLVASALGVTQPAESAVSAPAAPVTATTTGKATMETGFVDRTAIGGLSEPVGVAFAPDGTAFVALKTGVIKSFDHDAATGQFEAAATSTDFADLSVLVNNYGDRGMTGITVDPQFPARPYVYVNYTYNKEPGDPTVPRWGTPGQAYDDCPAEANLDPPVTGCTVMVRVSRLTAARNALGWVMSGPETVLVEDGCAQFSSHASGDVAFGPDGLLYASAGDGASFRGTDYGQANNPCGDPTDEGGSLRAQDQRTSSDPLGIDGTIFRLHPDTGLAPATADSAQWLVAMGQRNPWRFTFRQGREQLWSVDVGSSNWEEINQLPDAPSTALTNRGWPCYEGTTGVSVRNAAWDALDNPLCEGLYAAGPGAVQAPVFAYRTRTGATPLTAGENCPVRSSSLSGVAFAPLGTDWPAAYQDALYFSDFLRGCIWRLEKDANGQPNPGAIRVFAEAAGAPVDLSAGPGGDLYYVDYGTFVGDAYVAGSGAVHRIDHVGAATLKLRAWPKKVKIKVDGVKERTPYRARFTKGTRLKLKAPRFVRVRGVRYVFVEWTGKGIGRDEHKRRQKLTTGTKPIKVKAVYKKKR